MRSASRRGKKAKRPGFVESTLRLLHIDFVDVRISLVVLDVRCTAILLHLEIARRASILAKNPLNPAESKPR